MRISRKLAAPAAFFVLAAAVAGCGSSLPSGSVATVAGNPITLRAYKHWMYLAAKEQVAQAAAQGLKEPVIISSDPTDFTSCVKQIRAGLPTLRSASEASLQSDCKSVFTQDTTQVMQFLIEGYWFQAEAHKLGVRAPNLVKDFDKYLKKQWPTKAALASYLKSTGQTRDDLLFEYRVESLFVKLLKRYEKPVTKAAVASYYAAHKSSYGTPESRDLHLLLTKTRAKAQAAYDALKSGQSWATVADRYSSTAAGKVDGGLLTNVTPNQEEAAVNQAIFASPVGKVVGPIKGIFGYYVIEVTKVTPAVQEPLSKVAATIKTTIEQQEQSLAQAKVSALAKKAWQKQTTCATAYQVVECSNYKAPKTTSTSSTAPTG